MPESNQFDITVSRNYSPAAGNYKLKIHYIPVDVHLDDISVQREGTGKPESFANGAFAKTVQKYMINIDEQKGTYDIEALAAETKRALDAYVASQGLDPKDYPTKVKIGNAPPLGDGIEQLEKGDGTRSTAKATIDGEFTVVPVYVMVPNYSRKYETH